MFKSSEIKSSPGSRIPSTGITGSATCSHIFSETRWYRSYGCYPFLGDKKILLAVCVTLTALNNQKTLGITKYSGVFKLLSHICIQPAAVLKGRKDRSSESLSDFPKVTQLVTAEPLAEPPTRDSLHPPRCATVLFSNFIKSPFV